MVNIVINNQSWSCPTRWSEVTLLQMQALAEIVEKSPEKVRRRFQEQYEKRQGRGRLQSGVCNGQGRDRSANDVQETEEQKKSTNEKEESRFYAEVISVMTAIPLEMCLRTEPGEAKGFVERYLSSFIWILGVNSVCRALVMNGFEWNGERLEFPLSGRDVSGEIMPCIEIPAEVFCDATALFVADRWKYAALIIALLCRPAGEAFDQQKAMKRAETMGKLSVEIVLEVFAMLVGAHRYLKQEYPEFYGTGISSGGNDVSSVSYVAWSELPVLAAGGSPVEMDAVRRMSGYELVRLLAVKTELKKKQLL